MEAQNRTSAEPSDAPHQDSIARWWRTLPPATQAWLIEHNGEHLPPALVDDISTASGDGFNPAWWAGTCEESGAQLIDAVCDWIEEWANGEHR